MKKVIDSFFMAYIVAALLAISAGCTSTSVERRLQAAEALIETYPDSALTILRAIDRSGLGDEHRARCALLLSQAYDKSLIDIADDSLISIAFDYYSRSTDAPPRRRMMTFYYKGVTSYYNKDYQTAIYNLTIADSIAARINDWTYRGLSNSMISFSFKDFSDLERELDYSKRALGFFRLEGDSTHIRNQLYSVGLAFDQLKQYDSAMVYFDQAGYDFSSWGVASSLLGAGRIEDFRNHQDRFPYLASDPIIQGRYAKLLIENHRYEEASEVLQRVQPRLATSNDSIQWLIPHAYLMLANNDWSAYSADLQNLLQDEIDQNHLIKQKYSPAGRAMAREYLALDDLRTSNLKRARLYIWLICIIFVSIVVIMSVILINRSQRNKYNRQLLRLAELNTRMRRNNDGLMRKINVLSSEKDIWESRAVELHEKLILAEKSPGGTTAKDDLEYILECKQSLNTLYEKFILIPGTDPNGQQLKIRTAIDYYHQPNFTDRIDSYINNIYDNYITRSRAANLPPKDISLLRLLICGFSTPQISVIMDIPSASVATRKSRLKQKIAKAGLPPIPEI